MFSAMIKKEFLLVFRDKHALLVLFIMPAIFILIMSVALRDQFAIDKINFDVYINDLDKTLVSENLLKSLSDDDSFNVKSTKESVEFIVTIPRNFGDNKKLGIMVLGSIKSDLLEIFKAKLLKNVVQIKLNTLADKLETLSAESSSALKNLSMSDEDALTVVYEKNQKIPNSTQQIVPTWIVFGMFFVIIPMSTIYINERKQNTLLRLTSMNISVFAMTLSKTVPYLVINHIQVWIMLAVGMYLVPFLDTPALEINGSILALLVISLTLSFAAIGLSTLIAVSAKSSEQATTIGGVLNILLGAIGGVMVPKFIMPESMQRVAELSPMSWGLDGFLEIFLQSASVSGVLDESLKLFLFGATCITLAIFILKFKMNKGL